MPKLEMKYTANSGREFTITVELKDLCNKHCPPHTQVLATTTGNIDYEYC